MLDPEAKLQNMKRDLALLIEFMNFKGLWWRSLEVAPDKLGLCLAIMAKDSSFDASPEDYQMVRQAWIDMGHNESSGWWTY